VGKKARVRERRYGAGSELPQAVEGGLADTGESLDEVEPEAAEVEETPEAEAPEAVEAEAASDAEAEAEPEAEPEAEAEKAEATPAE
ncbi:MAG TPA: hypothetical protein VFL58_12225, partial [Gaiellaceae bacterium]|nr:hypothetical protein [Gaiellaceae bacterium]